MVKTRGLEVWNKASLKLWRQEQMLYGNFLIHEHRAHKLVLAFLQKESLRFLESRTACHWCLNTQFRQLQLVTCMPEFKRDALRLPLSIVFRGGKNCAIQRSNGERESDLTICSLFLKDQDVTIGSGNVRLWLPPSDPAFYPVREFIPKHEVQSVSGHVISRPVSNPKHAAGCHINGCSATRQDSGPQGVTRFMWLRPE